MATMYEVRSDIVAFIFNVTFEALSSSCTVVSRKSPLLDNHLNAMINASVPDLNLISTTTFTTLKIGLLDTYSCIK